MTRFVVTYVMLAALEVANRGWRVFPIRPGSKRPYFSRWHEKATCDVGLVEEWFGGIAYPFAGVGAIPPAGVVRVDVDRRADGDGWATVEAWDAAGMILPPTMSVRTPRGGSHLYYMTDETGLADAFVGPHVELKTGATILPPTRGYAWCGFGDEPTAVLPAWFTTASRRAVRAARRELRRGSGLLKAVSLAEVEWRIELLTGHAPRSRRSGHLSFCCPAHPDRHPSAWAIETPAGILVGCSAGCPASAIADALLGAIA